MPTEQEINKVLALADKCEELCDRLPGDGVHFYDHEGVEWNTVRRFQAIADTIRWLRSDGLPPPLTDASVTELKKHLGEQDQEDDEDEDEARIEAESEAVIALLAESYPGTVEYSIRGDHFDIFDADDNVIATITAREMSGFESRAADQVALLGESK